MSRGDKSKADASLESLLAPLVEEAVFFLGVWAMVGLAAAIGETRASEVIRRAHGYALSTSLDFGRSSHLLDQVVELGLSDSRLEVIKTSVHRGVSNLGRFLLVGFRRRSFKLSRRGRNFAVLEVVLGRQRRQPGHAADFHLVQSFAHVDIAND